MKEIITKYEYDTIIELNDENPALFEMIEDFALRCISAGKPVLKLNFDNGKKTIKADGYVGLLKLNDGTQIEIYPKTGDSTGYAKMMLGKLMSAYLDIPFEASLAAILEKPGSSFMEFFISVFIRETMKILKSGLLSGYTTVEENTTAMQGSILFSENIRRNLTHRERLYVRHDVFTPDRSENRLIKSAAVAMSKLTREHQNAQSLKQILGYLEDVQPSTDTERDLAGCVNTRNTKKYSAVLSLCRMVLKNRRNAASGKYVASSVFFSVNELFAAYAMKLAKAEYKGLIVRSQPKSAYICAEKRLFAAAPDIAVYEKDNSVRAVINTCWMRLRGENDIPDEEIFRLAVCAKALGCDNAVLLCPSNDEREDIVIHAELCGSFDITVRFAALASGIGGDEFYDLPPEDDTEDITDAEEIPVTAAAGEAEDAEISEIPENPFEQGEEIPEEAEVSEIPADPFAPRDKAPKKIKLVKRAKKR